MLIANRGEIAVRVSRTLRRLSLRSVAICSDADADALHVDAADIAMRVGPARASDSYLSIEAVLDAAARAGARAVHPGYGFLSENAAFARACETAGVLFVGPPSAAIELMGDKARAKQLAREAGVPVLPGLEGEVGAAEVRALGSEHGYPVVIKALAGGGGRGLRTVSGDGDAQDALDAARREAGAAFGDERVLVERYIPGARHIEVQVLADRHGTVVHLGERECSLQRRHQKVVEEAPSPVVDAAMRASMGAAATDLARACGYESAGTVEFVMDDRGAFFFLEMNTRLQVEHPVTELLYDLDLVELQLRVAAGEPLGLRQEELVPSGHAIEARLYAEDPAHGFLPSTGTIRHYREPQGVRVDSGVRAGTEVATHYDPLLAKLIALGPDRATALARLHRALGEMELLGVSTNTAFTRILLERPDVRAGELDTGLIERVLADPLPAPPVDLLAAAALAAAGTAHPQGPWRRDFEQGPARVFDGRVTVGEQAYEADIRALGEHAMRVTLDGVSRRYVIVLDEDAVLVSRDGHVLEARTLRRERARQSAGDSLAAPMPGTVLLVHAADGDEVAEGDVLMVLESMKMELSIAAPHAGVVADLALAPGDRVTLGQALATVVAIGGEQ